MLHSIKRSLNKGPFSVEKDFIRRWPKTPKVAFFGPPNVYLDEISQRFSIDLGVPIVSLSQIFSDVEQNTGVNPDYDHPFFKTVQEMIRADDPQALIDEQIAIKLLRLMPHAQEGFLLQDYPRSQGQAELLEQYKGGMNAFVHVSLPDEILVDIEESKIKCSDCNKVYYKEPIISEEHGVRIESHVPEDGHCDDCGSTNFEVGSDPQAFEAELTTYKQQKGELLAFYNHFGLLIDFELRHGYESYDKLKRSIQYGIKH